MHEYAIVGSLVEQVEKSALEHGDARVLRVEVRVGDLSGVDTGLLRTAWELFREGTRCAGAELALEREAVLWRCPSCEDVLVEGGILRCPRCGLPARLVAGDALVLERIEMEVGDV